MKNLSKKIGVGVVASSLIIGGAVSTGLVSNAESNFQYVKQPERKLSEKLGDLEIIKSLKHKYNFKVFGYYLEPKDQKNRMIEDLHQLIQWYKIKDSKKYEQVKDLENIVNSLVNKENISYDDIDPIQHKFKEFQDARYFFKDLLKNGIKEGIQKVKIGDALAIFVFESNIDSCENWDVKWDEDINKLIDDKFIEVKSDDSNKLKSNDDKIPVKEEWLGFSLRVKEDIEENDYKELLKDPNVSIER